MSYLYSVPEQFDPIDKGFMAYDITAIYQSISNIIGTPRGTRMFLPEFGCNIEQLLFEPMTELTTTLIYDEIVSSIPPWDPRIVIDYGESEVEAIYSENKYNIKIVFEIQGLADQKFEYLGTLLKG